MQNFELDTDSTSTFRVMVTNCQAVAFNLRVFAKARLLKKKRYPKPLERNERKNIGDLREDNSCGIQL